MEYKKEFLFRVVDLKKQKKKEEEEENKMKEEKDRINNIYVPLLTEDVEEIISNIKDDCF